MLIRPDGEASILISQPAHAWVSGQIARAWSTEEGTGFAPVEEVCLAAEQHDIGWLTWETSPALNPKTGLPYSFREMPRREHLQIWSRARRYTMSMNRYAALLVSRHGTGLFQNYGPGNDAPQAEKDQVAGFLRREQATQQRLIEQLSTDARYSKYVDDETLERNSELIRLWDLMSLIVCGAVDNTAFATGDYYLVPDNNDGNARFRVSPWPFSAGEVTIAVDGRRLTERYDRQITLQSALNRVEWVTLEVHLVP